MKAKIIDMDMLRPTAAEEAELKAKNDKYSSEEYDEEVGTANDSPGIIAAKGRAKYEAQKKLVEEMSEKNRKWWDSLSAAERQKYNDKIYTDIARARAKGSKK